jgi:hypothetical protein
MTLPMRSTLACIAFIALPACAEEVNGCPEGSYSLVLAPDGTTLSILFDKFTVESHPGSGIAGQRKVCRISAPLKLPPNRSIGVYKVDYRGFAKLAAKQETELDINYFLGPHDNLHGRVFKRKIKGAHEGDYFFTETIGAGQMKRVGCGAAAVLNVGITLDLVDAGEAGEAMASLDTADAAKRGAMVYHLDLKDCP